MLLILRNWGCELETDSSMESIGVNQLYNFMSVSVELTEEGLGHVPEVVSAIFHYIAAMKTNPPSEQMFNEFKLLAKLNLDFSDESEAGEYVESLASSMTRYEAKDFITGSTCLFEYDLKVMTVV